MSGAYGKGARIVEAIPSASYSMTLRVEMPNQAESLDAILTAVGAADGMVGAVDIVRMQGESSVRDITVNARNSEHGRKIVEAVEGLPETHVVNISDRTFLMHLGGKIEVRSKMHIRSRDDLSMAYTAGVARVCRAIEKTRSLPSTSRSNATPSRSSRTGRLCWASGT